MFKISLLFSFIGYSIVSYSQTGTPPSAPTNTIETKALESKKIKLSDEGHDHFMINFTIDNVINNSPDSFYKSNVFNPNIGFYFFYDLPLGKTGLSIAPGGGFTFSKVNLDGSLLTQNAQGTSFIPSKNDPLFASGGNGNYDGSGFYSSWFDIPLELRYRSKPINGRSRIKVAVGMRAGLNLTTNSKISYYDKTIQRELTSKVGPFSDLASFRYGATFRVGYGAINLFGYYGLNQLIKDNKNYNNLDLRQYSVGISLTGF